jgi:hypothetical protein
VRLAAQEWEMAIGARVRAATDCAGSATSATNGRPNFAAHAVADEKHSDLFVPLLQQYIADSERALKVADDALESFKLYHLGVAEEMERLR